MDLKEITTTDINFAAYIAVLTGIEPTLRPDDSRMYAFIFPTDESVLKARVSYHNDGVIAGKAYALAIRKYFLIVQAEKNSRRSYAIGGA